MKIFSINQYDIPVSEITYVKWHEYYLNHRMCFEATFYVGACKRNIDIAFKDRKQMEEERERFLNLVHKEEYSEIL